MPVDSDDKISIQELVARYNYSLDHFETETFVSFFCKDGALEVGQTRITGREPLRNLVEQRRLAGGPLLRHWSSNFIFRDEGEYCRVQSYVMAFNISDSLGAPYVMGEFEDDLVKEDGIWKFKVRRFKLVAGQPKSGQS